MNVEARGSVLSSKDDEDSGILSGFGSKRFWKRLAWTAGGFAIAAYAGVWAVGKLGLI